MVVLAFGLGACSKPVIRGSVDVPSNLDLVDRAVASVANQIAAAYDSLAGSDSQVRICAEGTSRHLGYFRDSFNAAWLASGHRAWVEEGGTTEDGESAPCDFAESAPGSYRLRVELLDLDLRYGRANGWFGPSPAIERRATVSVSVSVTAPGAELLWQRRIQGVEADSISAATRPLVEGGPIPPNDDSEEAPLVYEPVIAATVAVIMTYLFFSARDDQ